jgi:Mrp family chromosome partitioning ATPase
MTRLDRAFIKVYSKSSGVLNGPHVLRAPEASTTAQAAGNDNEDISRAHHGQPVREPAEHSTSLAGQLTSEGHTRIDSQHAEQPSPWAIPTEVSAFSTWDIPAPPAEAVLPAHAEVGTAVSALEEAALATESPLPERADSVLHAAFEVDNLLWPEINYSLAAACRPQWNQLVKEIVQASKEGQKILLVTSHRRGEGRTSLVLCLAQLLSQKQQRVAVVDADFQRPQIARQLKLLPACGWDDVLQASQPLTEAWIESVRDGVTLLPISDRSETKGLAGNPRLKQMLEALRQQNDVVLIDAGSLSDSNDREMLALLGGTAQIDAAIIVRDVRTTTFDTIHDNQRCLDAIGIGRWDVVENFAD